MICAPFLENTLLRYRGGEGTANARRFQSLHQEMDNSTAELRDNSAGRLTIGANESTTLYLLKHLERYREMYPKVKVQIRRSLSSKLPNELLDGKLVERNLGVAFLPRMCVEQEIEQKRLCEVRVKEMHVERKIRLIYPTRRGLSHAAKAFLEVVG